MVVVGGSRIVVDVDVGAGVVVVVVEPVPPVPSPPLPPPARAMPAPTAPAPTTAATIFFAVCDTGPSLPTKPAGSAPPPTFTVASERNGPTAPAVQARSFVNDAGGCALACAPTSLRAASLT